MGRLYSSSMAIDIPFLSSVYHYYAGLAATIEGTVKQTINNAHVYTLQEPLGVVAADTVKHLTMELGGKSANIVFADADLSTIGDIAYYSMFDNKGEICYGGSRMLVERSVFNNFVENIAKYTDL